MHVGLLPILLSPEEDFIPDASLFHHVLSKFLILFGKILVHNAGAPLFPPKFLNLPLYENVQKVKK
jgi:hypothetical protein